MILNDKYIIFLHKRYLKNKKLIKTLENKGIITIEFNKYIDNIKKKLLRNQPTLLFDNIHYPSVNILYIHLVDNSYYNYMIYNEKYIDYHQDILFITSIKLGAKKINYLFEKNKITLTKQYNLIENNLIDYKRGFYNYEINNQSKLEYNDININLKNLVYKRQDLKVLKLEYNIKSENITDFIYSILLILFEFKLINNFEKYTNISFNNNYTIEFYSDIELINYDQFIKIKNSNNITNVINYIYSLTDRKLLDTYIQNNSYSEFESISKKFNNTNEIIEWIDNNLTKNKEQLFTINQRNNYIKQIKNINIELDNIETDIMYEISNIADTNRELELLISENNNQIKNIYSEIENKNNIVNILHRDFSDNKLNEMDFDIQANHILEEINKFKDTCIKLSTNILENENKIEINNKLISNLYNKIKQIKQEKQKELDILNNKLIDETNFEYN